MEKNTQSNCPIQKSMNIFLTIMGSVKGREKYSKFLLIPTLFSEDSKSGVFLLSLSDVSSTFRKMIRLGKVVLNLKSIRDKLKSGISAGVIFECLSIFSETLYVLVDHVILFNKIKAYPFSKPVMDFVNYWENVLWVFETIFGIIGDIFYYIDFKNELRCINKRLYCKSKPESSSFPQTLNQDEYVEESEEDLLKRKEKIKTSIYKLMLDSGRLWSDLIYLIYSYGYTFVPRLAAGVFGVTASVLGVCQAIS